MAFKLSIRSQKALVGVHPDLVRWVKRAIQVTEIDFFVNEGVRTLERQRILFASGASHTMNSRHLVGSDGYGQAVDLVIWLGGVRWEMPLYKKLAPFVKQAALEVGVPVRWGFDLWEWDGPHWQLPTTKKYPG